MFLQPANNGLALKRHATHTAIGVCEDRNNTDSTDADGVTDRKATVANISSWCAKYIRELVGDLQVFPMIQAWRSEARYDWC